MKQILLVFTLGAALASSTVAQAQDSTTTPPSGPPPGGGHHDHEMGFLTAAEKAELKKAHDAAIAADPTLGIEEKDLMDQMKEAHESGNPPSDDLKDKWHAFRDKMDAAMIKADANVAPIIAKIKAHHHGPDGGPGPGASGGTPPPPPSGA